MDFANPTGVVGNVINDGVNELILPNYKQTWADIRKISDAPAVTRGVTFKSPEYSAG
jgi:arsenite oxidase large subunit